MNNKEINKVEHIWCIEDDRWVYIEYNDINKIIGLNFMQGNEYENFKEGWCNTNIALTKYYHKMCKIFQIEKDSHNRMDFINKVVWAYVECAMLIDEYGS